MSKKKAGKRFAKMGKLGRQILKLSNRQGIDVNRLVINPDNSIEVYLDSDGASMMTVRGFAE